MNKLKEKLKSSQATTTFWPLIILSAIFGIVLLIVGLVNPSIHEFFTDPYWWIVPIGFIVGPSIVIYITFGFIHCVFWIFEKIRRIKGI